MKITWEKNPTVTVRPSYGPNSFFSVMVRVFRADKFTYYTHACCLVENKIISAPAEKVHRSKRGLQTTTVSAASIRAARRIIGVIHL